MTGDILNNLAASYNIDKSYLRSLALHQRALDIKEGVLGAYHPSLSYSYINMANVYRRIKKYRVAEKYYQSALILLRSIYGAEYSDTKFVVQEIEELANIKQE